MELCGCVRGGLRKEFQTSGRRRPLARFIFWVAFLIWMASTVLLSQNPWVLILDCGAFPVDAVVGL